MADGDYVVGTGNASLVANTPAVVQIPITPGAAAPDVVEIYNIGPDAVWANAMADANTAEINGWSYIPAGGWKRLKYKGALVDIDTDMEATPNDLAIEVTVMNMTSTADVVIEAIA